MKKKTALLIDGGWFCKGLGAVLNLPGKWPTVAQVVKNANMALRADEELFRIFYYDCAPFDGEVKNPVDGTKTNYSLSRTFTSRKHFLQEMGQADFVALRLGELKVRGWDFKGAYRKAILTEAPRAPQPDEVYPNFEQKGVDMRIGIDVSTLSLKHVVERIILFSADTDMIPAMKLARREGLQVYVVRLNTWPLKGDLIEDSDGIREIKPVV
jgi:uncharacterized LabA/DUF88 family protein